MAKGGYRGPMMGGGMNANMMRQAQKMQHSGVFRPFESVTFALASSGFLDPRDSALGGMGTGIF